MDVILSLEKKKFMVCSYVWLDPHAENSGRKLFFSGIRYREEIELYDSIITISISSNTQYGDEILGLFKVAVYKFGEINLSEDKWWVYGDLYNDPPEYKQGIIDVFDVWQKGESFDWLGLPLHSSLKEDYNDACLKYSGLSTQIIDREIYQIDVSLILEEMDFYYWASLEFLGEKSYFGYNLHTFKDCLIELYKHNGYFHNKKVVFKKSDRVLSPSIEIFLVEIKNILSQFKFIVE